MVTSQCGRTHEVLRTVVRRHLSYLDALDFLSKLIMQASSGWYSMLNDHYCEKEPLLGELAKRHALFLTLLMLRCLSALSRVIGGS